ncbi:hypothetical protein [Peribacillus simplex]|uniref:HeH/LEM domain-containing protein n=1 Tax=Peribacillus simplex TaxID=1478 RepID=A0A9W4KSY6_9BACI|nr:hypothetical protein [Peribacillus simplex]CAH0186117.1 hypothetical protein SRABI133_01548 [Peribacillus simplex]
MSDESKVIKVKNAAGDEIEVTEKAFRVVYKAQGYKKIDDTNEKDGEVIDFFTLSTEELQGITKEKLKAFLDQESIDYNSNANKDELISLITGE